MDAREWSVCANLPPNDAFQRMGRLPVYERPSRLSGSWVIESGKLKWFRLNGVGAMQEIEVLLINSEAHAANALAASGVLPMRIVQSAGERVAIVLVAEHRVDAVRNRPEIAAFTKQVEIDEEALTGLTSGERLFVEAWRQQARVSEKLRPENGLSWDAAGYEAP